MGLVPTLLVAAAPACLLAGGLLSTRWANRHVAAMRRFVMALSAAAFGLAIAASAMLAALGPLDTSLRLNAPVPCSIGVYFDSLAAVMLLLVSFIGLIVTRYSLRYLDGDPTQGRFMRWISFTLGAALLLIVSNNLLMFTVAWLLTSFGLHKLLTHYADRPGAILAARKKFLISRLGDVMLIAALLLTYRVFGSVEYSQIFAAAQTIHDRGAESDWLLPCIGSLYVLGAMTKSAQFPFHSWLPDTMETPTPVSALMHAGIVNAGGFLVIRLSPLISLGHLPLDVLTLVGAITALFGAVVMLTQTSIKRSLAYSTIAQMGFMMLQCGLGAFSAALLHIVAHSLYKAHAFLSSGSVLEATAGMKMDPVATGKPRKSNLALLVSGIAATGICGAAAWGIGVLTYEKPGGLLLGMILAIAVTHLLWKSIAMWRWRVATGGLLASVAVTVSYYAAYVLMDRLLATSVSHFVVPLSAIDTVLMFIVAAGFLSLFALQVGLVHSNHSPRLRSLYVHASNGFYLDVATEKITVQIWKRFFTAK